MKLTATQTTPPITAEQLERLAGIVRTLRKPVSKDDPSHLPDPLNPPDEVQAAALAALGAWADVWHDGPRALERAVDYTAGISAGASVEGHGKGGHGDPTENAASLPDRYTSNSGPLTSDPDFVPMSKPRPDTFRLQGDQLRQSIIDAAGMSSKAARQARRIIDTAPPMSESDRARCASFDVGCEEYAVKKGYCSPCSQWIYDNDGQTPVPKSVIQARIDRAAQRLASAS